MQLSQMPERKTVTFNADAQWTQQEKKASIWLCSTILLLVGLPSLAVAAVSTTFNAMFAYSLGANDQEKYAWLLASLGFSLFVVGIPIARPLIREKRPDLDHKALILWLACLFFSITSALGFAATTRDHSAATASYAIEKRTAHQAEIARLQAQLDKMPPERPHGAVEAEIRQVMSQSALAQFKTKGCTEIETRRDQKACARVLELRTELATIRETDELADRIDQLRKQPDNGVLATSADPQAETISWLTGGRIEQGMVRRMLSVFVALLVEAGSAIGLSVAAEAFVAVLRERSNATPEPAPQQVPAVMDLKAIQLPTVGSQLDAESGFMEWANRCLSFGANARVKAAEAFSQYETWCAQNGATPLQYLVFGRRMSDYVARNGGQVKQSNGRVYEGVKVNDVSSPALLEGPHA